MKRILLGAGAAVLLLVLCVGGFRLVRGLAFFRVRRVELVGARYVTALTLTRAMNIPARTSVFDPTKSFQRRALQVAGIREARVSRRIPGTLRVTVVETEPVALAERSGRLVLIDATGRVLPFDPTLHPADLPVAEPDSAVAGLLALIRETEPGLYARVERGSRIKRDVALDLGTGRIWFRAGATGEDIRNLMVVEGYLTRKGRTWRELDARFASRVVVRGAGA
jgi:cell division septal protein FtsQ